MTRNKESAAPGPGAADGFGMGEIVARTDIDHTPFSAPLSMTPRSPRRDVTDELISLYARIRIAHAQRQRAAELAAKVGSLDFPAEDAQAVELAEAVADLADGFDRLAGLPEGGD